MGKEYWITEFWSNAAAAAAAKSLQSCPTPCDPIDSLDTSVGNVNPSGLVYL